VAATNGLRDRLSPEQLGFVGFESEQQVGIKTIPTSNVWLQPTNPSTIDRQLDELERLRDIAPGWIALAKRILE
jgi:hypothetical protein